MDPFIASLQSEFIRHGNAEIARSQKAYMKHRFEFFGILTPLRRTLQKPFLEEAFLPPKPKLAPLVKQLWDLPQRDLHLFGQELTERYIRLPEKQDLTLYEHMLTHNSWWDTVDFISPKLVGSWFRNFPEKREIVIDRWLGTNNIWLHRCALLFQLYYRDHLDRNLLEHVIRSLQGSREFFINKAIGWILRQYSRTDADWVIQFTNRINLHPLSRREALRSIEKKLRVIQP